MDNGWQYKRRKRAKYTRQRQKYRQAEAKQHKSRQISQDQQKKQGNRTKNEQTAREKTARKQSRIADFNKRKHGHKIRKSDNGKAEMETDKEERKQTNHSHKTTANHTIKGKQGRTRQYPDK